MTYVVLYISTAVAFLALDIVMLKKVLNPMFTENIGHIMAAEPRMGAAGVFYLMYIAGMLYFTSIPALASGSVVQALVSGAILGALAYGTFEFTNYAILRDWTVTMVVTDVIWGAVLTGVSAAVGVWVTKQLMSV